MKDKKNIKEGFELTDVNSDNKISRAEDSDANELTNKFDLMDSYTPASSSDVVPNEVEDKKLDKWELNDKIAMWQVESMLKTYGDSPVTMTARSKNQDGGNAKHCALSWESGTKKVSFTATQG